MATKTAVQRLEEKLVKITYNQKAKGWENFDVKKFEKDASKVRDTFSQDETILSKRDY